MNVTATTRRGDVATWLSLMGLTLTSFALSDTGGGRRAMVAIMFVATGKAALVAFQFMRLHAAHVVWRLAFVALLLCFLVVTVALRWSA